MLKSKYKKMLKSKHKRNAEVKTLLSLSTFWFLFQTALIFL